MNASGSHTLRALVSLLCGCGGAVASETPVAPTLAAYARALRDGDMEAARALEHPSLHARDEPRVAAERELRQLGETLETLPPERARVRVRATTADGTKVVLARGTDGDFRIEAGVFSVPANEEIEDALATLARALERRDMRALERLLSRPARTEWDRRVDILTFELGSAADVRIDEDGQRATVTTPSGISFELVREEGEWRLLEGLPQP